MQKRTMNLKVVAVVADESQLPKFVHEKTDARSGGADELCQSLLADVGNPRDNLRHAGLLAGS